MAEPEQSPQPDVKKQGVLSLTIRDRAVLYAAYMPFLKVEPHFKLIVDDQRYLALIKKMKFPDDN